MSCVKGKRQVSHNLLLTTITPEGSTSAEVRAQVASILSADPSFVGGGVPDGGYFFASPVADYFILGGAWSGYLTGEEFERSWELDNGRDCDAILVTQELYEKHLKEFEGQSSYDTEFVDLDREEVSPDFIGRKFLIVVDYHV